MTPKNRTLEGKNRTLGGRGGQKSSDIIYVEGEQKKSRQTVLSLEVIS